jgi:hypothetical protein
MSKRSISSGDTRHAGLCSWRLAAAAAVWLGCGERTTTGVPAGEFIDRVAATSCEGDAECLDAWRRDAVGIDIAASADAGRIAYDAAAAAECLAALGDADCLTLNMLNLKWPWQLTGVAGCDRMLRPLLPTGELCASSIECTGGGHCYILEGGTQAQCVAPRAAGEHCPMPYACADDLYCNASSTCTPQVQPGAACTAADQCAGGGDCEQAICRLPSSAC